MNKIDMSKFINSARDLIQKRTPEILTGVGIAGMVTCENCALAGDAEHNSRACLLFHRISRS